MRSQENGAALGGITPQTAGMRAKAALAATMVRMPATRTVLRAPTDCLARALMGVLSAAWTSIVVDVRAGSWLRSITCASGPGSGSGSGVWLCVRFQGQGSEAVSGSGSALRCRP